MPWPGACCEYRPRTDGNDVPHPFSPLATRHSPPCHSPSSTPLPTLRLVRHTLLHDRLHHGRLEVAVDRPSDVRLDHQDGDELLLRVDPEVGAERAVPAEAAVGPEGPGPDRVLDHLDRET